MNSIKDVAAAAKLVAFGFQPGLTPLRNIEYSTLAKRCGSDPVFAQMVHAVAQGFDVIVLAADTNAGLVLGAGTGTQFAVRVTDHIPKLDHRPIATLAHLAIAALAFYRPEDLDDDTHVGRVTVRHVDELVDQAAQELERRAAESDADDGVPVDDPDLIQMWRYYRRRNPVAATGDARAHSGSRLAIIKRVAEYLADNGMLRRAGNENGGTYQTTARYKIHVRELAGQQMLGQLAALGVTVAAPEDTGAAGPGSITPASASDAPVVPESGA
jgi:hypothetical protein